MEGKPIKNIPSFQKLQKDAENFKAFKKAWPFLRPLFRVLGANTKEIDQALLKVDDLVTQTDKLISIPDEFNSLFSDRGWIMYSLMNVEIATKAIELGKSGTIDEAENLLLEYYTPDRIERELKFMIAVEAFRCRMQLADKALIDFREGRYYSSVLVVLSLLDGMVNDIQQRGFFSQEVDLTAWDSIAAHSNGLQKLVSVLSQSRKKTRTETIDVPFRHGIMHGMDLGYDNKIVAIKSWVALFATRDWAIKAERNQLEAPPPIPEKTWKELLQDLRNLDQDKKAIAEWKSREIKVGITIPECGEIGDYGENTPEQKLVEFLQYWKTNNYGYMAKCISKQFGFPDKELPRNIRIEYDGKRLQSWKLKEVMDEAPAITVISVEATYEENGLTKTKIVQARLICEDDNNFGIIRGKPGSRWALVSWHLGEIK